MAFEASTLVNGEWTTRTLDVNDVLRHYNDQDQRAAVKHVIEVEKAPILGLLTQTVIGSPLAHWILPARLRDLRTYYTAFIGDDFVQIKELSPDGLLKDIIRKEILGARIRNAVIVGSIKEYEKDKSVYSNGTGIKAEDNNIHMAEDGVLPGTSSTGSVLPPQAILLQLSTGESVFLMLQWSEGKKVEFVVSRRRVAKPMLHMQPGTHLIVDPSSRYMAIGCSEGVFAVYSLYSRERLKIQYSEGTQPSHVESERHFFPSGSIHKMEFLYPYDANDDNQVILLVLIVARGKTRMLLYEWDADTDMKSIKLHNLKGHLLPDLRQDPLLVIPLTIKSSFIIVYEDCMTVCRGLLEGSPQFIDFNDNANDPPASSHHGLGTPLWTSWARPTRDAEYKKTRDDLYLVREDGLLKFLEIDSEIEEFVSTCHSIGFLGANVGTAFAILDYHNTGIPETGDLLVSGGSSCAGGTYLIQARQGPVLKERVQNWSPALDIITTASDLIRDIPGATERRSTKGTVQGTVPVPDRIFAITGNGGYGAITEFRNGFEAKIGLEMQYHTPIMNAWMFPPGMFDKPDVQARASSILLSFGDRSSVLHISDDAARVEELSDELTDLDVESRTITASSQGNCGIQVTENFIRIRNGPQLHSIGTLELVAIHQEESLLTPQQTISDAVIGDGVVVFTTYHQSSLFIGAVHFDTDTDTEYMDTEINIPQLGTTFYSLGKFSTAITCLSLAHIDEILCAIVAEWDETTITLAFQPATGGNIRASKITQTQDATTTLDAFVSLVVAEYLSTNISLLCGTRTGALVALEIDKTSFEVIACRVYRVGATSVMVSKDKSPTSGELFFVNCDSKIYGVTYDTAGSESSTRAQSPVINRIWLTNVPNPGMCQPMVNHITRPQHDLFDRRNGDILLVAESKLLIARLLPEVKAVPRHISIGGSPSRLMYSHSLGVLIVGTSIDGRSTLQFIDPDADPISDPSSRLDVSKPMDQKGKDFPAEFISGLGNHHEKILRLFEWSYVKDGKTWNFLIVSTNTGRVLIISIDEANRMRTRRISLEPRAPRPEIEYFTRYKFKCDEPVHSVTGFAEGLLWCAGDKLFCDILDLADKRFKRVADYDLPSPATSLTYDNGKIYALTTRHSLEVLELNFSEDGGWIINRTHGDQVTRNTLHHLIVDRPAPTPIHLVSDKTGGVTGLWATQNTKADTLETIFESQLAYSTLRLRFGKVRPVWDSSWTRGDMSNRTPATSKNFLGSREGLEILGLSVTGALTNYTLLNHTQWQVFRFIVNLAKASSKACEFTYVDDDIQLSTTREPKIMMHIDGDILKRCLEERLLKEILRIGEESEQAGKIQRRFCELLQELHGEDLLNDASEVYIERAYLDLQFWLRPVI